MTHEPSQSETRRVFVLHGAAMALLGVHLGVIGIMPVLLRKTFNAGEWQTTIATMAIPAMAVLTLFWNEVYARVATRKFLIGLWLTNHVPLAGISFCESASTVLVFYVISTATFCGVNLIGLTAVVIYNAMAMTGVQLAGTMVPLELARNPSHASTYVGIHITLVGPRAVIDHVAAVALYEFTGRIELPLLVAAFMYAGGAILMIRLEREHRASVRTRLDPR